MQDSPICRFCLDPQMGKGNPLIDPCSCKGSIQFVHVLCLDRWRRVDPGKNGEVCLLCFTPYTTLQLALEVVPKTTFLVFLLRVPCFLWVGVSYGCLLHSVAVPKSDPLVLYERYMYGYQMVYACLFVSQWRVKHKLLYWQSWPPRYFFILLGLHAACNLLIWNHQFLSVFLLTFLMSSSWSRHCAILEHINGLI